MSPAVLERSARVLLRAYPAQYRRERGEEIIATLLEGAPPGRYFPSARETWSLVAGGRHARAALNRGPSTRANLRLALLLGTALYLSAMADLPLGSLTGFGGDHTALWRVLASAVLYTAALLAPWRGRRAVTTVLVIASGTMLADQLLTPGPLTSQAIAMLAKLLIPMGALAALSGGPVRLPRSWAWLLGVAPAGLVPISHSLPGGVFLYDNRQLLLAAAVTCWLVTDARPAFAFVIAQLLALVLGVMFGLSFLGSPLLGGFLTGQFSPPLTFGLAILPLVVWLLRRQTTPGLLSPP